MVFQAQCYRLFTILDFRTTVRQLLKHGTS